jgi:hypothetical protein
MCEDSGNIPLRTAIEGDAEKQKSTHFLKFAAENGFKILKDRFGIPWV